MRVYLEADGAQALEVDVAAGSLEVIPLPAGDSATLTLQPASMLDIGAGAGKLTSALQKRDEKFGDYRTSDD